MVPSTQLQYSVESTGKYKSKVVRYLLVFTMRKGGGGGGVYLLLLWCRSLWRIQISPCEWLRSFMLLRL